MAVVLTAPLKPTGFWSYATSDDTHSGGRLSQLRTLLAGALQQQIGREPIVHLFQDVKTIPPGADWDRQIHDAINDASFFIPIVTPGFLHSEWCAREVLTFAARQQSLGRNDLIFPIYQIDVEDFSGVRQRELYDPAVLTLLRRHQWMDFRELEFEAMDSPAVRLQVRRMAQGIRGALYREVAKPAAVPIPVPAVVAPPAAPHDPEPIPRHDPPPVPAQTPAMPAGPVRRTHVWAWPLALVSVVAVVVAGVLIYQRGGLMAPGQQVASRSPGTEVVSPPPVVRPVERPAPPVSKPSDVATPDQVKAEPPPPVQTPSERPAETPSTAGPATGVPGFDNGMRDCDRLCPRIVLIPKGDFVMGVSDSESRRENSEAADSRARPPHPATIGQAFYLSETLVTRGEYNECVAARKCKAADVPSFPQTDNDPVVNVSYDDAIAYASWLKAITGKDYRLPSESEWEYAARAGTQTARYWGDDFDDRRGDTVPRAKQATMPVKSYAPNKFGLYDILGNVWQWTEDCWNDDYRGGQPADEHPRTSGGCWARVLRGGSWYSNARLVRAGIRDRYNAGYRYAYTGFRVARNF